MGAYSLGKIEMAGSQVLPLRGSRCKTSLIYEAFKPPRGITTTTCIPGPKEDISNQTSIVKQLKQQRKGVKIRAPKLLWQFACQELNADTNMLYFVFACCYYYWRWKCKWREMEDA
jgi:hypothetical protein